MPLLLWMTYALALLSTPPEATAPSALSVDELKVQLASLLHEPALRRAKVGLDIVRLDTQTQIFGYREKVPLIPASNVKLVTTAAALEYLSPDFQFFTNVYGQMGRDGRIQGDLFLQGDGDPYLIPERVWYLASRLSFLGLEEITGDIVVDDSYFAGDRMANGWIEDRTSSAYMAPAGAVSVGFNAVMVHVAPATHAGELAHLFVDPVSDYASVRNNVRTVSHGRTNVQVSVVPDGHGQSVIHVAGRIKVGEAGRAFWRRIDNPPIFAGSVLKNALKQVGIKFSGKIRQGHVTDDATHLLQYGSPRLAELLNPLNKYSNNFMAMQLGLALGAKRYGTPGTWDKAHRAIDAFLIDDVKLVPKSFQINNASGLHSVNRLTPAQITQLLTHMYGRPQSFYEYATSLAVGAGSGTLQDRMLHSPAAHVVRAKTGTLSEASALSGYVVSQDRIWIAFSFLINDYRHLHDIWNAQDKLAALLAQTHLGAGSLPGTAEAAHVADPMPMPSSQVSP